MSDASNLKRVHSLVAPIIADLKLDLYDLEFRGGTLRITIDTPAGSPAGIDLEAIALATRLIGREFDHHDPLPGHYTLEVTSPGLERTLRTPAHYQRELGKTIAVRLRDTVNTGRRLQGVLIAADDQSATIRLDAPDADGLLERTVAFNQIDRARTVFVWGPAPKPGVKPAAAKPTKAAAKTPASKKEEAR
jgi:ribosome maturation factor RimP